MKKVPILTEQMVATIICIDKHKITTHHPRQGFDELLFVLDGSGTLVVGGTENELKEGMLVVVPGSMPHSYSTAQERLCVMSISSIPVDEALPSCPREAEQGRSNEQGGEK